MSKIKKTRPTKRDFFYAKRRLEYWMNYLGVKDWETDLTWGTEEPDEGPCMMSVSVHSWEGRLAEFKIYTDWGLSVVTYKALNRAALHECLELLFWPVYESLKPHYSTEFISGIMHQLIRTFENAILKEGIL